MSRDMNRTRKGKSGSVKAIKPGHNNASGWTISEDEFIYCSEKSNTETSRYTISKRGLKVWLL